MKKIPEIQAERQRLLLRLEENTTAIRNEIEQIKHNLSPGHLLSSAVENITESVQEGELGASVGELAISMIPTRWFQNPLLNLGIRLAMPWIVEKLMDLGQRLGSMISWEGVRETISDTVEEVQHVFKQTSDVDSEATLSTKEEVQPVI